MSQTALSSYFYHGQWGRNGESISGPGSTLAFTASLRLMLAGLLKHLQVKTFVDAPCGDFNWMQHMDLSGINYIGLDIVPEIIAENQRRFAAKGIAFAQADICVDPLPAADLFMARDVLIHLPHASIFQFFDNFLRHDIAFLLTTSHHHAENLDVARPGGFRPLNLLEAPFCCPKPLAVLPDYPRTPRGLKHPRDLLLFSRQSLVEWRAAHV